MKRIRYSGQTLTFTSTKPDEKAKKVPAYAAKTLLTNGLISYESGQDSQGKDVARTYSTIRISEDLVVDDAHTSTRCTSQFVLTGPTTPSGQLQQLEAAKAHLIALCANDFAELKLRLYYNGTDATELTEARLTAVETAALVA